MTLFLVVMLFGGAQEPAPVRSDRFEEVSRHANEARGQEQWDDAERLYREGVRLRPDWKEGWWSLGTILYDQNRYEAARVALSRFTVLDPKVAPSWAFLGLCEYETGKYGEALMHLEQGMNLGLDETSQLSVVTRYHAALLLTRMGEFDASLEILMRSAQQGNHGPTFEEAAGLAAMRKPLLPSELPLADRELVLQVGRAVMDTGARRTADAQNEFQSLVAAYPKEPNLHYLFGSFLLTTNPDAGMKELKKELEISPRNVPALVQIAFEHLKRGDPALALPYARTAAREDPKAFVAHIALGRALLESGDLDNGVKELETAKQLSPDSPQTHIALASAYAKAGRAADAARERAEFQKLKRLSKKPE
jgi:tetratricopeptide (TPR) repeat protein